MPDQESETDQHREGGGGSPYLADSPAAPRQAQRLTEQAVAEVRSGPLAENVGQQALVLPGIIHASVHSVWRS